MFIIKKAKKNNNKIIVNCLHMNKLDKKHYVNDVKKKKEPLFSDDLANNFFFP